MKDNLQAILFAVIIGFAGFRIYQKYFKKDDAKSGSGKKPGTSFGSSSKDDDYEPYAKK